MDNIRVNKIGAASYIPKATNNVARANMQSARTSYTYPVYTQVPYGIRKTDYIKLGVKKLESGHYMHLYLLTNGQKVGIIQGSSQKTMIYNRVNTGAYDEPDGKEGLSHLIEHSIYHGSKKYPDDIDKHIDSIGGYTNAHTSIDETCYYIKLNDSSKINEALDINADMIYNPLFSKLDKEKAIVTSELQESEADELSVVCHAVQKMLLSISKPDIKDPVAGSVASLNSVTKEDMIDYHNKHYTPSNITTTIISDKNPDELIETVARSFREASQNKIYPPVPKKAQRPIDSPRRQDIISKDANEKTIIVGFDFKPGNEKDIIRLQAFAELVKMRANAFAYVDMDLYNNSRSLFFLSSGIDINEYDNFEQLKNAFASIATNPPDDYELNCIKNALSLQIDKKYENSELEVEAACREFSKYGDIYDQKAVVKALTKNDILDVLNNIDIARSSVVVLHPCDTSREQIYKDYQDSLSYVSSTVLPQQYVNVDVSSSLVSYDVKPYVNDRMYAVILPDNTHLSMINSTGDKCSIYWNLFNTNTNEYNPAIKYVLDEMLAKSNSEDKYRKAKDAIEMSGTFSSPDGISLSVSCDMENIDQAVKLLRKELDIDFSEQYFKGAKEDALNAIKFKKELASDKRTAEKDGISNLENPQELEEALKNVTLNDVRKYYNEIINNSYSFVNVSAPFNNNPELFNKVASLIYIPNHKFKKQDDSMYVKSYFENPQSSVYMAVDEATQPQFECVHNFMISHNPEDEVKFKLLAKVLNKRIYDDLRERQGLVYTPRAYYGNFGNRGKIGIVASSSCNNEGDIKKIFEGFRLNTEYLMRNPITTEELQKAKNELKFEISDFSNNLVDLQSSIVDKLKNPIGLNILANSSEILESITPEDIQKAAQYVFSSKPDYLIDAPRKFFGIHRNYFKTLGEIKE